MQPLLCNRSIVQPHPLIIQLVVFQHHYFPLVFCPENSQLSPKNAENHRKSSIFCVLSTKKALIIVSKLH